MLHVLDLGHPLIDFLPRWFWVLAILAFFRFSCVSTPDSTSMLEISRLGSNFKRRTKKLNATLNILFFCKKVFDFKQHGINDGVSHKRIFDAKELIWESWQISAFEHYEKKIRTDSVSSFWHPPLKSYNFHIYSDFNSLPRIGIGIVWQWMKARWRSTGSRVERSSCWSQPRWSFM